MNKMHISKRMQFLIEINVSLNLNHSFKLYVYLSISCFFARYPLTHTPNLPHMSERKKKITALYVLHTQNIAHTSLVSVYA